MSTFYWPMEISPLNGSQYETVNALVDTNAPFSQIPSPVLARLGITPTGAIRAKSPDGRDIEAPLAEARARIGDLKTATWIIFAPQHTTPILGNYTLAGLRLTVDPSAQRLIPATLKRIQH